MPALDVNQPLDLSGLKPQITEQRLHGGTKSSRLEWWYLTGPLWDAKQVPQACSNPTFPQTPPEPLAGVQLTFFSLKDKNQSGLLGHFGWSNAAAKTHSFVSRAEPLENGHSLLGDVSTGFLDTRLADWRLTELARFPSPVWLAEMTNKDSRLSLELRPQGLPWLHGNGGVVAKIGGDKNFYYSFPFVSAQGTLVSHTEKESQRTLVCGNVWFDHEIDVSPRNDVNWNWFAIRFSDGEAVMIYQLSSANGETNISGEKWKGNQSIALEKVTLVPQDKQCLASGRCYPMSWQINYQVRQKSETILLTALFPEQEMSLPDSGRVYWEGIARARKGKSMGQAYMELVPSKK